MIVAGGSYLEICAAAGWRRLLGSGGRAAAAISGLSPGSELYSYASSEWVRDIECSMQVFGIVPNLTVIKEEISFSYSHPLADVVMEPRAPAMHSPLSVKGDVVLRFGFVEGDAIVNARCAVYDPQTGGVPPAFGANGSQASSVAVILNEWEATQATGSPIPRAGFQLLEINDADVSVIKSGARGATVFLRGREPYFVPAYRAAKIFKIGSGDIFSVVFAHAWGEKQMDPIEAAYTASRSVARFVCSQELPLGPLSGEESADLSPIVGKPGRVYLAGPFFDTAQRWFVDEVRDLLRVAGVEVFSPLHDVGIDLAPRDLAAADLQGLTTCSAVLALVDGGDPGTIFEVGYATARGIPVVVLAERTEDIHLTMMSAPGVEIVRDLTTAIYHAVWASMR